MTGTVTPFITRKGPAGRVPRDPPNKRNARGALFIGIVSRYGAYLGSEDAAEDYGHMAFEAGVYLGLRESDKPQHRAMAADYLQCLRENLATLRLNGAGAWGQGDPRKHFES